MNHPLKALFLSAILIQCVEPTPTGFQTCPVSYEENRFRAGGCRAPSEVSILVVLDTGPGMAEPQRRLSAGLSELVHLLTRSDPEQPSDRPVETVRLAVVTTDMGLQINGRSPAPESSAAPGCSQMGDDGLFQPAACVAASPGYAETGPLAPNNSMPAQAACLAHMGENNRCALSQGFAAIQKAAHHQAAFFEPGQILTVIFVSDRDDCSLADRDLLSTDPWQNDTPTPIDVRCAHTDAEAHLLPFSLPFNMSYVTMVLSIVGVPQGDSVCEGTAPDVEACLGREEMVAALAPSASEEGVADLSAACTDQALDGAWEIHAAPARRYLAAAGQWKQNGFTYAICNRYYTPAMAALASAIRYEVSPHTYLHQRWKLLPKAEREAMGCDNCGRSALSLDAVVLCSLSDPAGTDCPAKFYENLDEATKAELLARKRVERYDDHQKIYCPINGFATPLPCHEAERFMVQRHANEPGWYYCIPAERNGQTCADGIDNDEDGQIDCADRDCMDQASCTGGNPRQVKTDYELRIVPPGLGTGYFFDIVEPVVTSASSSGCIENGHDACNDEADNNGDGVWDCEDTSRDTTADFPHFADPGCCPMTKDADSLCVVDEAALKATCGTKDWRSVGACLAAQEALGCLFEGDGTEE